jgi:plasmid stabilization system protein ParE
VRLVWQEAALAALRAITERGNAFSDGSGTRLAERLKRAAKDAGTFPYSGRQVPGYGLPRMRERIVGPYRLIYFVYTRHVEIWAVVHGSRDLAAGDGEPG